MTGEGQTHGAAARSFRTNNQPLEQGCSSLRIITGDVSHEVPTQNYPLLSGQTRTEQVAARLWNLFYSSCVIMQNTNENVYATVGPALS